jgi:putative transposase
MVSPSSRRPLVDRLRTKFAFLERRASELVGQNRSIQRYESVHEDDAELARRITELAAERPCFGYRRIHTLLRREGREVNHKKVSRLYGGLGLAVRRNERKRVAQADRAAAPKAEAVNDCWSMDFVSDSINDGRALRFFAVADDHSRLCPCIDADTSLPAGRVIRALEAAIEVHGKPRAIRTDNGPEFTSRALDQWPHEQGITHHFIRPRKPVENAFAESFNGGLRDEFQNQHLFSSVRHARDFAQEWVEDYNTIPPHPALRGLSPQEYIQPQAQTEAGVHCPRPAAKDPTEHEPLKPAEKSKTVRT